MRKQELTDNSGRWFDLDTAKQWREATCWAGGPDDVSRATGGEHQHEKLFLTTHGTFVLHSWDDANPTFDTWQEADWENAVKWLISNGYQKDVQSWNLQSEEKQPI